MLRVAVAELESHAAENERQQHDGDRKIDSWNDDRECEREGPHERVGIVLLVGRAGESEARRFRWNNMLFGMRPPRVTSGSSAKNSSALQPFGHSSVI